MRNSKGEVVNLLKLSNATVANPVNRRNELMTRLRGAEEEANRRGDVGLFMTITCPSRFHNTLSANGQQNPKWDGCTPRQASEYLSGVWQKVRAAINRQGIRMYGIRISEPQHDATPHWHMLVFVSPEDKEYLISVIKNYAMQDSPDEAGAAKYRFDVEYIDKKKGGATSYIAKYISKNIDGFGLEKEDNDILIKAFRVEAWASCWGIRQFQSFGLPYITGWRELRKVKQELPESSPFHLSHAAADSGDFASYIRAMGGVCIPTRKRPIKLLYDANFDKETGEIKLGQYDREPLFKVVGLQSNGKHLLTRTESWHRCSESGAA
ncbi:replication endonuclease [Idiomarina sp. ATCH4]|nr:replication endonuclease [Idiomarina sp. ATCH4]